MCSFQKSLFYLMPPGLLEWCPTPWNLLIIFTTLASIYPFLLNSGATFSFSDINTATILNTLYLFLLQSCYIVIVDDSPAFTLVELLNGKFKILCLV